MADKLIIFDTTLRDGEQSPGASMTREHSQHKGPYATATGLLFLGCGFEP